MGKWRDGQILERVCKIQGFYLEMEIAGKKEWPHWIKFKKWPLVFLLMAFPVLLFDLIQRNTFYLIYFLFHYNALGLIPYFSF